MPTTRRNGQLWSCEPCRKSKLRCDHTTPVCGRCVRRNREHLCIYHPAPLTTNNPPQGKRRKQKIPLSAGSSNESDDWSQKKASWSTPGFLGQTSYFDVFADGENGLQIGGPSSSPDSISVNLERIQLGARALALLKHLPIYREILTARYKIWKGWSLGWPITNMILTSTEEIWASIQSEEPDEAHQTLLMSRRLFEKHNQPIEIHSNTTLAEFASAFAGRWETIGLLFTTIGLAAEYLPNGHFVNMDEYHDKNYESEKISLISTAIGDLCLQFCDSAGIINDMQCWLLLHHISLLTIVYGDSDYRPWRKLGDLASTTFALGLHQESKNCPFFLREMRKRSMVGSYAMDKALATFLGRPPLISGRYCDLRMPLDLSCEQINAEPAEIEAAIEGLDSAGWNQDGSLERGACARVTLIGAIIREKVLELSLCQTQDLPERVE
ncbi:hypothetical protein N7478_009214 [Penicillium angulare]|uniref:uncharacterized protein n=1 Tax=Penicillium angulare TaxID=116970 RepID=UPI00254057F7|nr:uncharacterized protein N7478_009214 [Penicillium angulare]KAJ5274089.1 hypothetical protein N7478_009214 [Penicillium angulare]